MWGEKLSIIMDKKTRFVGIPQDIKRILVAMTCIYMKPGLKNINLLENLSNENVEIASLLGDNYELTLKGD